MEARVCTRRSRVCTIGDACAGKPAVETCSRECVFKTLLKPKSISNRKRPCRYFQKRDIREYQVGAPPLFALQALGAQGGGQGRGLLRPPQRAQEDARPELRPQSPQARRPLARQHLQLQSRRHTRPASNVKYLILERLVRLVSGLEGTMESVCWRATGHVLEYVGTVQSPNRMLKRTGVTENETQMSGLSSGAGLGGRETAAALPAAAALGQPAPHLRTAQAQHVRTSRGGDYANPLKRATRLRNLVQYPSRWILHIDLAARCFALQPQFSGTRTYSKIH